MIYERLTIPVLPRLKVSIEIVGDTYTVVYEFDLIPEIVMDWIRFGREQWTDVHRTELLSYTW